MAATLEELVAFLDKTLSKQKPREYGDDESPGEVHMGNYDDCYWAGHQDGCNETSDGVRDFLKEHGLIAA